MARTLSSLGDAEGAREWFDRGLAALEGPAHPRTRLRRGLLSFERAGCESDDDVGAPTRRISWLKEAVREGLASGEPDGRVLACRAGLDLAVQLRGLGDCAGAADEARAGGERPPRACARHRRVCGTEAKLALGMALLDAGDEDAALAALREAVERGRHAVLPDARQYAAVAAWHLHAALLGDRKVAEAGPGARRARGTGAGAWRPPRPVFVR